MRRFLKQLADAFRGPSVRDGQVARGTQLGIETLESRTVLSADFGAVHEFMEPRDRFDMPPQVFAERATPPLPLMALVSQLEKADGEQWLPSGIEEQKLPNPGGIPFRHDAHDQAWSSIRQSIELKNTQDQPLSVASGQLDVENERTGGAGGGGDGRQFSRAPQEPNIDLDLRGGNDDALASTFTSLQPPTWESIVQRFIESRHVSQPPFLSAMISLTTEADLNAGDDVDSLLATYASWAASTNANDATAVTHDAAFDDYAVTGEDDANRAAYLQILAEDQAGSRPTAETGGFVDLDEAGVVDAEKLSNLAAENQRQAIESALRTLAARRGSGRTMLQVEDLLEQAWLTAAAAKSTEATANQLAEEPGGMILLQSLSNETGDDLFAAGSAAAIVQTTVEMEATIGAFQAFDVSVDEASAVLIKPATGDAGAQQDRATQKEAAAADHQTAGGFGALAIGAMALAAKRRINSRRRKPK